MSKHYDASKHYEEGESFFFELPVARVNPDRQPSSDTGIYLFMHRHEWIEVGTHKWPSGTVDPVWRCRVCTNIICTSAAPVRREPTEDSMEEPTC